MFEVFYLPCIWKLKKIHQEGAGGLNLCVCPCVCVSGGCELKFERSINYIWRYVFNGLTRGQAPYTPVGISRHMFAFTHTPFSLNLFSQVTSCPNEHFCSNRLSVESSVEKKSAIGTYFESTHRQNKFDVKFWTFIHRYTTTKQWSRRWCDLT